MKKLILTASLAMITLYTFAQEPLKINPFKLNNQFDLSVGASNKGFVESFSFKHIWGLGKNEQWRIGGGLRFSSYQGSNIDYTSAPPKYVGNNDLIDTVTAATAQQNNLALMLTATYRIKKKLELGFNIDLVGYSFGGQQNVQFQSNGVFIPTTAKANSPTALLAGPNDLGMIRAEFMVGYWVSNKIMLRLGATSLNTEYKTTVELQDGNSRFRANSQIPFIAITYSPKNK